MDIYNIQTYDYDLPEGLIAYNPAGERGSSRMLVLDRGKNSLIDCHVADILGHIDENVIVVANNTKVVPARLIGEKTPSGGRVDCVLLEDKGRDAGLFVWDALIKGHRMRKGQRILFKDIEAVFLGRGRLGFFKELREEDMERIGYMPLPPYIKRRPGDSDRERYQTVFAREKGSIAAPTAGLHFTEPLLNEIKAKADRFIEVTLHIGYGTFAPVKCEDIREHIMHKEHFSVDMADLRYILENKAKKRVLAIGTTSVRALESVAVPLMEGNVPETGVYRGTTSIFIYPGYEFKIVDMLFTNFHLPKSTLFMLASAFTGLDKLKHAYNHAIAQGYRFFSYGDAMLIK